MLTNTETSLAAADAQTIIALDAIEAQDPRAHVLLVGALATISIGCDSYAGRVVSATASLKTIVVEYVGAGVSEKRLTFRMTKRGYRADRSYRLSIGFSETHLPREV